jgi:hypothetical protein
MVFQPTLHRCGGWSSQPVWLSCLFVVTLARTRCSDACVAVVRFFCSRQPPSLLPGSGPSPVRQLSIATMRLLRLPLSSWPRLVCRLARSITGMAMFSLIQPAAIAGCWFLGVVDRWHPLRFCPCAERRLSRVPRFPNVKLCHALGPRQYCIAARFAAIAPCGFASLAPQLQQGRLCWYDVCFRGSITWLCLSLFTLRAALSDDDAKLASVECANS